MFPGQIRQGCAKRALTRHAHWCIRAGIVYGSHRERLAPQVRAVARVGRFDAAIWEGRKPIQSFEHSELEEYRETNGPPFDTSSEARGGTRLIKAQSECPFKAFAAHRLRAALPDDASFGFDALDRGGFVHAALETVWKELRTQERLLAATPDELRELVRAGVEKALTGQNGTEFYSEASEVERQRLEKLIYDWLVTVESIRTVPFTVESAEEPMHIELAGLPLSVRLDRIDRLNNGGLVLIDYKSGGNINKNRLIGERPAEPQLLVYAASKAGNIEGASLRLHCAARAYVRRLYPLEADQLAEGSSKQRLVRLSCGSA